MRAMKRLFSKARRRHHQYFSQLSRWNAAAGDILEFRFELENVTSALHARLAELSVVE
jgi:hypothetical protein